MYRNESVRVVLLLFCSHSAFVLCGCLLAGLAPGWEVRRLPVGGGTTRPAGRSRQEHPGTDDGAVLLSGPAGSRPRPLWLVASANVPSETRTSVVFFTHVLPVRPQVVCGQNCTFVIQPNGTVLACGEGSYGRLGQGNSDDLHVLTVISALQGDPWEYLPLLPTHTHTHRRANISLAEVRSACFFLFRFLVF